MAALQSVMALLPDENRDALHCLLLFLNRLAAFSTENQMTASNLAICFAPSLFHVYGLRSQTAGTNGPVSVSPRRDSSKQHATSNTTAAAAAVAVAAALVAANGTGLLDENDLVEQRAAHECLTTMISNVNRLFVIPTEMQTLHGLLVSHLMQQQQQQQLQLTESFTESNFSNVRTHVETYIREVVKESQEPANPGGWIPVKTTASSTTTSDVIELSYQMSPLPSPDDVGGVTSSSPFPPRVWRCHADISGVKPADILARLLHERHLWDDHVTKWRVAKQLDEQTDVFHYVTSSDVTRPAVDFCELRSWRTELLGGQCAVLVSFSVQHPQVKPLNDCIRGQIFGSHFFIEPRGDNECRLTHISRADVRGHGVEWYRKFYGHVCAYRLARICESLRRSTAHAREPPTPATGDVSSSRTTCSQNGRDFIC
jgi:hypothetical protein